MPQRHAGLVVLWAGSWGLWELLGAGPALVGMMLPPLHTKHPLCSQVGAETCLAAGQQLWPQASQ